MNLKNIKFDQEVTFSEYTIRNEKSERTRFTDIQEVNPIPTKSIIYKTVTGIGATHSEILAKRNSIIVLPHISIVRSKNEDCQAKEINTLAIYGNVKQGAILDYLFSDNEYAKILTTPKGLDKLIRAMEEIRKHYPDIQHKKLFFLLIDECHKFIKDADYRADMVDIMDHFFEFDNKAMVSATPLPSRDPRFVKQGFKSIKVAPDYDYRQELELIHTNSLANALQFYLKENNSDHYCIFFNSIEGINSIIDQLGISNDSKIYCSQESSDILKSGGVNYSTPAIDNELKRFNFYTSSFFNGLDINLNVKPNIILLTDNGYKSHTLLDPYTDVLQIIGRFRRDESGAIPYNKITHINNAKNVTNPISEEEALKRVEQSKLVHSHINTLKCSVADQSLEELFNQALSTVKPYSKLLNKSQTLSYFRLDNYLDNERIKHYYSSPTALLNEYCATNLYRVSNKRDFYEKDEFINLQKKSIRYSIEMNKRMASYLLALEEFQGLDIYYQQQNEIGKLSFIIYKGYTSLGYGKLTALKFNKRKIEDALLKLDIESKKNSFPLIDLIYKNFKLNVVYSRKIIKEKLIAIYEAFELPAKAVATDLERYFKIKSKDTKQGNERTYIFTERKLFPVNQTKHI